MKSRNFLQLTLAAVCAFSTITMCAQVTIGSVKPPSEFSILELISNDARGLRLPQLTTAQRNAMQAKFGALARTEARGLQIFNTDTNCVEVWNGSIWISMCTASAAGGAIVPPPHFDTDRCGDDNPLRDFTAVRLNDGLPHPQSFTFQHPAGITNILNQAQIHFNMMPVTGGVFYRGAQSSDPNGANFIASNDPNGAPHPLASPVHQVALNSFFIGQAPVTRELFMAVMAFEGTVNGHELKDLRPLLWEAGRPNRDVDFPWGTAITTPNHPRNRVNWYDAVVFCNRLSAIMGRQLVYQTNNPGVTGVNLLNPPSFPTNTALAFCSIRDAWDKAIYKPETDDNHWLNLNGFRLPTEAEWEYAARGGQQNEYTRTLGASGAQFQWSGSNNINAVAWWGRNAAGDGGAGNSNIPGPGGQSQPVMQRQPNELDVFDMSGNVWEWCWDWVSTYADLCFLNNPTGDPRNADGTTTTGHWNRVHRGGSWDATATVSRVSMRSTSQVPAFRSSVRGFRLAASAL